MPPPPPLEDDAAAPELPEGAPPEPDDDDPVAPLDAGPLLDPGPVSVPEDEPDPWGAAPDELLAPAPDDELSPLPLDPPAPCDPEPPEDDDPPPGSETGCVVVALPEEQAACPRSINNGSDERRCHVWAIIVLAF